ncbi:MAG: leucine-rich repeat protein [Candidatus Bathyarchaeota archaeon]|nr:leucine-rich repeat protein [Candidatus Termitimicrobium sp.]
MDWLVSVVSNPEVHRFITEFTATYLLQGGLTGAKRWLNKEKRTIEWQLCHCLQKALEATATHFHWPKNKQDISKDFLSKISSIQFSTKFADSFNNTVFFKIFQDATGQKATKATIAYFADSFSRQLAKSEYSELREYLKIKGFLKSDGKTAPSDSSIVSTVVNGGKLVDYINFVRTAYNKIKFLNQEFPHDKLYVNLHLTYKTVDPKVLQQVEHICDSTQLLTTSEPCVLIGPAGSGKSTIVRKLMLQEVQTENFSRIPVFVEIPKLSKMLSSGKLLHEYISHITGFTINNLRQIGELNKKILLILDGMDEVESLEKLDEVVNATERFIHEYKNTKLIFTSRPSCTKIKDENVFSVGGQKVEKYFIEEMTEEERKEQIKRIVSEVLPKLDKDKFWRDLLELEKINCNITDITRNPLLLSLMLNVYQEEAIDGDLQGSFPKNKIELYERAVKLLIKDRPETHIEYLSCDLIPHVSTLLGRIAFTLYEESQKMQYNGKISEHLIKQDVKNYVAYLLKCSQDYAIHLTDEFFNFIERRSIFTDKKFIHETFKEYFTSIFLFNTLFFSHNTPFGSKIELIDEKIFDDKINPLYTNPNNCSVIEMLLCYIDRETPNDETAINSALDKILINSLSTKPNYNMLCKTAGQFVNHQNIMATNLIVSMFERGCEKVVNPFAELFWFMSEYNLKAGITNGMKNPEGHKDVIGLENAFNVITNRYTNDQQKLVIANICYHLYRYIYIDVDTAWDEYKNYEKQLTDDIKNVVVRDWWTDSDSAFIWTEKDVRYHSGKGNLLYLKAVSDDSCFNGDNTRFIKLSPNNTKFFTDGVTVYSSDKSVLYHHVRKGHYEPEFIIPNSVTHIRASAFANWTDLTKITIPNSVVDIGSNAFAGCTNLSSITLPNSVVDIGSNAFAGCTNLSSITLPNSINTIKAGLFMKCNNIQNIVIPKSVHIIEERAFEGCNKCIFYVEENNPCFYSDGKIIFNKNKTSIISFPTASGNVIIPDSIDKVDDYAFSQCHELSQITFLGTISLGNNVFNGCTKLAHVVFSDTTTQIERHSFPNKFLLKDAKTDTDTMCLKYPFIMIMNTETGHWNGYIPDLAIFCECLTIDGIVDELYIILKNFMYLATKYGTEIPAPSSIEDLSKKWQEYETSLLELTDDKGICLWFNPFYGCRNLKTITIPKSISNIAKNMFSTYPDFRIICHPRSYAEQYAQEKEIPVEYIDEP